MLRFLTHETGRKLPLASIGASEGNRHRGSVTEGHTCQTPEQTYNQIIDFNNKISELPRMVF